MKSLRSVSVYFSRISDLPISAFWVKRGTNQGSRERHAAQRRRWWCRKAVERGISEKKTEPESLPACLTNRRSRSAPTLPLITSVHIEQVLSFSAQQANDQSAVCVDLIRQLGLIVSTTEGMKLKH